MKTILTFNKHGGIRRSTQFNYRGKLNQNSYKYRGIKQLIKPNIYGIYYQNCIKNQIDLDEMEREAIAVTSLFYQDELEI